MGGLLFARWYIYGRWKKKKKKKKRHRLEAQQPAAKQVTKPHCRLKHQPLVRACNAHPPVSPWCWRFCCNSNTRSPHMHLIPVWRGRGETGHLAGAVWAPYDSRLTSNNCRTLCLHPQNRKVPRDLPQHLRINSTKGSWSHDGIRSPIPLKY